MDIRGIYEYHHDGDLLVHYLPAGTCCSYRLGNYALGHDAHGGFGGIARKGGVDAGLSNKVVAVLKAPHEVGPNLCRATFTCQKEGENVGLVLVHLGLRNHDAVRRLLGELLTHCGQPAAEGRRETRASQIRIIEWQDKDSEPTVKYFEIDGSYRPQSSAPTWDQKLPF